MKIVKYIFLLLLLASIATTVFIATQDGKYNIRKEKSINVSRPVLYNYLNDYKNWENLGLFASADTTATFAYSENSSGKGAFMDWKKEGQGGKIQTIAVKANDSITQKATLDNLDADVSWTFKDTLKSSTKVSIRLTGRLTFTEKAYALLNGGIDKSIESSLDKGLVNLNNFLVKEIQKYSTEVVGVVNKKGAFYLGTNATLPLADVNKKAITAFDKLLAFARENNITVTGKPFILYKTINNETKRAACTYSIPIKDEMFTAPGSDYEGGKLLPFNALKTTLRGDYSHLPKAWEAARKYISQKGLQENTTAQYLEIYTKSVAQTRRPSMLITDVYIPMGVPAIIEKDTLLPPAAPRATTPAAATGTKPATTATPKQAASAGSSTTTRPAATRTTKPATTTTKPAPTSPAAKPTGNTPVKPAGATTAKPASTTPKPATTKPGITTQPKPAGSTTAKPAATTAKPAAITPAKPKPAKSTAKPGADDLNPPRA